MNIYFGNSNSKSSKLKSCYFSDTTGKARKVKKIYYGVNNLSRLCYQEELPPLELINLFANVSSYSSSVNYRPFICAPDNSLAIQSSGSGTTKPNGFMFFVLRNVPKGSKYRFYISKSSKIGSTARIVLLDYDSGGEKEEEIWNSNSSNSDSIIVGTTNFALYGLQIKFLGTAVNCKLDNFYINDINLLQSKYYKQYLQNSNYVKFT